MIRKPPWPVPPLTTKIILPTNLTSLWYYCPRKLAPNHPDFASMHIIIAHSIPFPKLLAAFLAWSKQHQVTLMLNLIQEEQTQEIGWLVYSTKHTNCHKLDMAIMVALQTPAALQFKQISTGWPKGTKAHACPCYGWSLTSNTSNIKTSRHIWRNQPQQQGHAISFRPATPPGPASSNAECNKLRAAWLLAAKTSSIVLLQTGDPSNTRHFSHQWRIQSDDR